MSGKKTPWNERWNDAPSRPKQALALVFGRILWNCSVVLSCFAFFLGWDRLNREKIEKQTEKLKERRSPWPGDPWRRGEEGRPARGRRGELSTTCNKTLVLCRRGGSPTLVEEEKACSVGCGHVLRHVADLQVVDEPSEEKQEACSGWKERSVYSW